MPAGIILDNWHWNCYSIVRYALDQVKLKCLIVKIYDLMSHGAFEMRDEDKTREKLLEEVVELRQRVAQLEESEIGRKQIQERFLISERVATLEQFSGSISHELRNPLGVIDSSVYYLRTKLKDADIKVQRHLDRISSSVSTAITTIESLLDLTQMHGPHLARVDLAAILSDVIAGYKIPPRVNMVQELAEPEILVNGDRGQLRMAFKNIIKNAVEAIDGSGTLTIAVRRNDDDLAEVSFVDTGPGIASENLDKIFQPLFSTKAKGIGFGLAITKMVVDRHGGTVEASSDPEKGAILTLRLPLYADISKEV